MFCSIALSRVTSLLSDAASMETAVDDAEPSLSCTPFWATPWACEASICTVIGAVGFCKVLPATLLMVWPAPSGRLLSWL